MCSDGFTIYLFVFVIVHFFLVLLLLKGQLAWLFSILYTAGSGKISQTTLLTQIFFRLHLKPQCSWHSPSPSCVSLFPFVLWVVLLFFPRREAGDVWCLPLSGISGLSFDSTLLSPFLFFCLVLLLFLSYLFFFCCLLVHSSELFLENTLIFFVKRKAFLYGSCLAARRSKLVGGMCSLLPYDTVICCYAFI